MKIKVLLADDHRMVREGIQALLNEEPGLEIVGSVSTGLEALQKALELHPDVIIMDIAMPELNGIEACYRIIQDRPDIKIIMLSMHSTSEHIYRTFQAGARGYLLKDSAGDELLTAIHTVRSGERYITQRIADTILDSYISQKTNESERTPLSLLSQREREVLQLVAEGKNNNEIAVMLSLSQKTVETYRSRIMQKLNLKDLHALIKFAIRHGLISIE